MTSLQSDIAEAREFLLPSPSEVVGCLSPGWVEPRSLRAKDSIIRILGWEDAWPFPPGFTRESQEAARTDRSYPA